MLVDWPNSIITGGCSDQIQPVQMASATRSFINHCEVQFYGSSPAVPPVVSYRHVPDWQRSSAELPEQCSPIFVMVVKPRGFDCDCQPQGGRELGIDRTVKISESPFTHRD